MAAAAAPLSITTQAPLPGGEVGVAYTQAFAATGGTPPYTWSVSGAAQRPHAECRGQPYGNAGGGGDIPFTVQVTDSAKATATKSFTITVTAALTITTATLPNGTVGILIGYHSRRDRRDPAVHLVRFHRALPTVSL